MILCGILLRAFILFPTEGFFSFAEIRVLLLSFANASAAYVYMYTAQNDLAGDYLPFF